MAFEDVLTQGSKGTNSPWQRAVLKFLYNISQNGGSGPPTQRATTLQRENSAGSTPAGIQSASFYNAGAVNATVAGGALKPGEQVTFSVIAGSDSIAAINYDGTGTDLLITTIG